MAGTGDDGTPSTTSTSHPERRSHANNDSNTSSDKSRNSSQSTPSQRTKTLWIEVASGIDKNQTVVWKNAVDSLKEALLFLIVSKDAQYFVETYMKPVISILLEQQPSKIGQMEKNCVEESLRLSVIIVAEDLKSKASVDAGHCVILDVLGMIFNRKKNYYKGSKPNWNVNLTGLPEVRISMINKFRSYRGFAALATYLSGRVTTSHFPSIETLHLLLGATCEAIPTHMNNPDQASKIKIIEDDATNVAKAVMNFMDSASEDMLKKQSHENLNTLRYDLQRIFDKIASTRRKDTYLFYEFWRGFALKLITSQSLPLKLFGWETVTDLIEASADMRPPPKSFIVSHAGCTFVNGLYEYTGALTDDGFAKPGSEVRYELHIQNSISDTDGGGKKLTLFRCTMRSSHKWWFLSEADEEQPGTDKDIDYYQHKSKKHEENEPPSFGWVTCRASGVDPPPKLKSSGIMVPIGEEYNTMEHQLARWAIENEIINLVLGNSIHREIVARSVPLIKFLASMCDRDEPIEARPDMKPNLYCLQSSHLKLAWKTCTGKADAAVSAEVYHLLVSILPKLPDNLAKSLLNSIQASLHEDGKNQDSLVEVAEFCSALASANPMDMEVGNNGQPLTSVMSDSVRSEILKLLWGVLTHPDSSTLKYYDHLKNYVANELRIEPLGSAQKSQFMYSCKVYLKANSKSAVSNTDVDIIDESHALRTVKLTQFILESCSSKQALSMITENDAALATLLFQELVAYLNRRAGSTAAHLSRKPNSMNSIDNHHSIALSERLNILRYAYGLSEEVTMSNEQLNHLWDLCDEPSDREALMVFLANASSNETKLGTGTSAEDVNMPAQHSQASNYMKQSLTAAYSGEVRIYAFQTLFCSESLNWEQLGFSSYQSFQTLFKSLTKSVRKSLTSDGPALAALWRICLAAGNDDVATQAMRDLLGVYSAISAMKKFNTSSDMKDSDYNSSSSEVQATTEDSFAQRIFECLLKVKGDLENREPSSERSAERCIRILNAAVGHRNSDGESISSGVSQTIALSISSSNTIFDALQSVPHGMRGQMCYRTIGILAKRTPQSHGISSNTGSQFSQMRDDNGNLNAMANSQSSARMQSSHRFSLQVHPLETLLSVRKKVAHYCNHPFYLVKPLSVSSRQANVVSRDSMQNNLNIVADKSRIVDLNILEGCEVVFLLANQQPPDSSSTFNTKKQTKKSGLDLSELFAGDGGGGSSDQFFDTLLAVLEALPIGSNNYLDKFNVGGTRTHQHVWDLLLSMPTNAGIIDRVRAAAQTPFEDYTSPSRDLNSVKDEDSMMLDTIRRDEEWDALLQFSCFQRSVYVLQVVDSFLQSAVEILSNAEPEKEVILRNQLTLDSASFRRGFIESGGFNAVLRFFTFKQSLIGQNDHKYSMGYAFAIRILKCCFFGSSKAVASTYDSPTITRVVDDIGKSLLLSLKDSKSLLFSLTSVIINGTNVSDDTVLDVLQLLELLFGFKESITREFSSLPNSTSEKFLITLLLWESKGPITITNISSGSRIKRTTEELILKIPTLSSCSLPWLIRALGTVNVKSDGTNEFFSVLIKLVEKSNVEGERVFSPSLSMLKALSTAVCVKLGSHPHPSPDASSFDLSSGVLCGCLKLLRALIECSGGVSTLHEGVGILLKKTNSQSWSNMSDTHNPSGVFDILSQPFRPKNQNACFIDLMGVIFDYFLSCSDPSSSTAICLDKDSRQLGFSVLESCAASCKAGEGYMVLARRIRNIVSSTAPTLRHRWGQHISSEERGLSRMTNHTLKYSGLRNQGCTCYMNSVLQQLFMMPGLRKNICSALLPSVLRSAGGSSAVRGEELIGKRISLQWENGISYDALVLSYEKSSGMHTIRYSPIQIANSGNSQSASMGHHQSQQINLEDISALPQELADEFILCEGRPGKETGLFEVLVPNNAEESGVNGNALSSGESTCEVRAKGPKNSAINQSNDEIEAQRLLEEVQRTFVHLDEGARGRCFDPRALVEASGCLKLEFDIWQQNDASEFAMKLLDRLEVPLKRWSVDRFKYLERTFRLKQTKQKICKECGLKTNREENLMNIDCQIRGKSDIHEALSTMCEVELMEGDNKVYCDNCKKKTDTILRTAISALPDVLILSLKRFDLDYNTFETIKLNSRCAFGQTLNMRQFTLEGIEASESDANNTSGTDEDQILDSGDPKADVGNNDEDYQYKLAGVLVHAGVAQGGHYYSFIKDRSSELSKDSDKWYRFDDEDVTPFDPSLIEVECFGGKVKKETKWPNGQIHTVESEQFANALMLFYEKVKPAKCQENKGEVENKDSEMEEAKSIDLSLEMKSGYDIFQPDVRQSNATHNWHAFLLDTEFQSFLLELMHLCLSPSDISSNCNSMEISTPISSPSHLPKIDELKSEWCLALLNLSLQFFLDVLLHSADKDQLNEWVVKLSSSLNHFEEGGKIFVQELAKRTHEVSGNWLRIYCCECPEENSRAAALQLIANALKVCLKNPGEVDLLLNWTQAWTDQMDERSKNIKGRSIPPVPTALNPKWQTLEDASKINKGEASSIGIIISYLTHLLEILPRTWRHIPYFCAFLKEIGSLRKEHGGDILRKSLIVAQIPARLICLALRERSPTLLAASFPGSSVSIEIAEALVKQETNPSSHLLPLSGNSVGMGSGVGSGGSTASMPSAADHVNFLEALASIIGINGTNRTAFMSCCVEFKGRTIVELSGATADALTIVFHQCKSPSVGGMSQRDIQKQMKLCGLDASAIPQQRIANILNKYSTVTAGEIGKECKYLTLEGFLAYYRDTVQSNEVQVRCDLNNFGFRPDLSLRPEKSRVICAGNHTNNYQRSESVAIDVSIMLKSNSPPPLGQLAELGLSSFYLYQLAYCANEHVAEYILAWCTYGKDTSRLLVDTLRSLRRAQPNWGGNEIIQACTMVLRILAALPDDRQQERITTIMQSMEKAHPHAETGVGLLCVAKELSSRHTQSYSTDYHHGYFDRYVDVLKELQQQQEVFKWMSKRPALWGWMEQWLRTDLVSSSQNQSRSDYLSGRDGGPIISGSLRCHNHSDSDMNAGMNESDEEDDDSRYGLPYEHDNYMNEGKVIVSGAGVKAVNGVYMRNGSFDNVAKYNKTGVWKDREEVFSLFRCRLSDQTRRWYISIVPKNIAPGTNKDIDFYSAPALNDHCEYPPEDTWSTSKGEGLDPSPTLTWKSEVIPDNEEDPSENGRMLTVEDDVIEDEADEGQMRYI